MNVKLPIYKGKNINLKYADNSLSQLFKYVQVIMLVSYSLEKPESQGLAESTHDHGTLLLSCGDFRKRPSQSLSSRQSRRHAFKGRKTSWFSSWNFKRLEVFICRRAVIFRLRRSFLPLHSARDVPRCSLASGGLSCTRVVYVFTVAAPNFSLLVWIKVQRSDWWFELLLQEFSVLTPKTTVNTAIKYTVANIHQWNRHDSMNYLA